MAFYGGNHAFHMEEHFVYPTDELPDKKTEVRFKLVTDIDKEALNRHLSSNADVQPEKYLSEPEVYTDDDDRVIVITGYAPNNNYDVQNILDVVLCYDDEATLI